MIIIIFFSPLEICFNVLVESIFLLGFETVHGFVNLSLLSNFVPILGLVQNYQRTGKLIGPNLVVSSGPTVDRSGPNPL